MNTDTWVRMCVLHTVYVSREEKYSSLDGMSFTESFGRVAGGFENKRYTIIYKTPNLCFKKCYKYWSSIVDCSSVMLRLSFNNIFE